MIDEIEVTCIDNGMPEVILRANDLGIAGYEAIAELEANVDLKKKLEGIRLKAGLLMNLGDVREKTIPKMCLVSPPIRGGAIHTRTFIPHVVHEAIGVLGAVSTATARLIKGSVTEGVAMLSKNGMGNISVEHPSGEFTVNLEVRIDQGKFNVLKSGVIRSARLLSKGEVFIPGLIWP